MQPRPPDLTPEKLAEYEQSRQEWLAEEGHTLLRIPPAEIWYSGCWLKEKLLELNCPEDLAERIGWAVGQRQAANPDAWQVVYTALENYKKGEWEEPGEELGLKIMKEQFGENPTPADVIQWFASQGVNPGQLMELMTRFAIQGKSALPQPPRKPDV